MFLCTSSGNRRQSTIDRQFVQRLQANDPEAFAELYDRYSRAIYGLILRIVRDPALAEDLLQDVFLKVWKSAALLDSEALSPGPWLMVVARNQVLDYLKSGQNQRALRSAPLIDAPRRLSFPEYDAVIEDRAQSLRGGLDQLESRQRQVLELAYFEGLTQVEMAEVLCAPLGTVKSWVRQALRNLKKILDKEGC
jgi:RNA polymerase sigma-70 factor (ECF subfamily)